jgi:toxin ParE1/3/4
VRVSWHPNVGADLIQAAKYYEGLREGLGIEFLHEAERVVREVIRHPSYWRQVHRSGIRRSRFDRFPYAVFYSLRGSSHSVLRILGVMSGYQNPLQYRRRR